MLFKYLLLCFAIILLSGCVVKEVEIVKTNQVEIKDFQFTPPYVEINKGENVIWTNNDRTFFNLVIEGNITYDLYPSETYSHTFTKAGTYEYFCDKHKWMKGTVIVLD